MTFDIPFDQPLDVRLHGYINRTREDPHGNSMPHVFLNPVTFLGTQEQHGSERKVCLPGRRGNNPHCVGYSM